MRVYCPPENIQGNKLSICDKEELHHILNVLRLKRGDALYVFDGVKEYECAISEATKEKLAATIIKIKKMKKSPALNITLACAIPKKAKMDYIIEKCTELGVDKIIPLITERTIVKLAKEKADVKLKRWQKIAQEASKQSGRIGFPTVEQVSKFKDIINRVRDYDLALIPNLESGNKNLNEVFSKFSGKSIIIFIGPEGDFTEREIELAQKSGCLGISLGGLVLKVDTAAIAVASFLHLSI